MLHYNALISLKTEYTSSVWDQHNKVHIDNKEKIKKGAARYVSNNYIMEYGNTALNLKSSCWRSLKVED